MALSTRWQHHHNRNRPHSSLRDLTPHEFVRRSQVVRNDEGGDFSLELSQFGSKLSTSGRDRRREAKTSRRPPESAPNSLIGRHRSSDSAHLPFPNRAPKRETR